MEVEGREVLKHVCKFCSKIFPCGRSLGGHMRSHITNVSADQEEEKLKKKKIQCVVINGGAGSSKVGEYDLRENPKKTWRFADSRSEEETPLVTTEDKFCKDCGKAFHSWKALFGHMKCHSEKASINSNNNKSNLENQDSASHKFLTDSQSDNEGTGNNPNRRRRSKRRTRFGTTASTSSMSIANPSSSVSEVEQEQEEVAMSLMMLSRDVGHWAGLNSLVESSDNNSAYFEARSYVVRTNLSSKIETAEVKLTIGSNSDSANLNSKGKKPESLATGSALFKAIKATVSINGLVKNCKEKKHKVDNQSTFLENSEDGRWKGEANGTGLDSSVKRRFSDSEVKSNCKKGKFKCTTCNRIFHSYQALGGHRSSHKKLKGCSASRNESSENSIETDLNNGYVIEKQEELIGSVNFENEDEIVAGLKKKKVHECPICLKIFPSGQALGGHKRSHFIAEGSSLVLEKPVQEIRDFLDLNLPASAEEEINSQVENYPPWWVVQGHHHHHPKQEPLVGLISN